MLDRLTEEHRVIHDVLDSVDRALVDFITTPHDPTELQEVADLLSDALLSHLAYEERELIDPSSATASTEWISWPWADGVRGRIEREGAPLW